MMAMSEKHFSGLPLHQAPDAETFGRRAVLILTGALTLFIGSSFYLREYFLAGQVWRIITYNGGLTSTSVVDSAEGLEQYQLCGSSSNARETFLCEAEKASSVFANWIDSQSADLQQAMEHYTRRYHRPTPPWFAQWYNFSQANNVRVIDDYDQLELDLLPLRLMKNRSEALVSMEKVYEQNLNGRYNQVSLFSVHHGNSSLTCEASHMKEACSAFDQIIDPIEHLLPDLKILVNWGDLPQIRGPQRSATKHVVQRYGQKDGDYASFAIKACPVDGGVLDTSSIERLSSKTRHDPCNEDDLTILKDRHGKFQNNNWQYNVTFPILSTAKTMVDQDILFPMRGCQTGFSLPKDTKSWQEKSSSLYWRGSNSGQIMTQDNWNRGQRARWVMDAQMWNKTIARLLEKGEVAAKNSVYADLQAADTADGRDLTFDGFKALQNLRLDTLNVSFSQIAYCHSDKVPCQNLEQASPPTSWMPRSASFDHKLLFDLDGYGMSERFYSLLLSNSAVLKQTEWAEWHDERLIPWVHYIPVTQQLREMPELVDFLLNDEKGRHIAERVALQSTQWSLEQLSIKAQASYMLRLFFEYADLFRV